MHSLRTVPYPAGIPSTAFADFEQALSVFITAVETEEDALWRQADVAYHMTARFGRLTARWIAQNTGKSEQYIRSLIAAAKAFPRSTDRVFHDLSMSHYRAAAVTTDPAVWMQRAQTEQWSVEDLRWAIRLAQDPIAEHFAWSADQQRLQHLVQQFNHRWGTTMHVDLLWSRLDADTR